ncbi:MAG: tetratricopeptide repeat protein [Candidatus Omnitrophica bacterium]|nr:tetratricopeptide repeat protein [Candidatus Omnitrophota bacterium]
MGSPFRSKTSLLQKIIVIICGIFFSLIILESAIRAGGFIISFLREQKNIASAKKNGSCRIMCLGESTTAGQYPHILEKVLNNRNMGISFSVIDKGVTAADSSALLLTLEENLDKYHPDIVIAMMGYNDRYILYYKDIPESGTWLFRYSSLYRFIRLMYARVLKKIKKEGYYQVDEDSLKPEAAKIINEEQSNKYKWLFRKAIELNPKNDWAYFGLGCIYKSENKYHEAERLFRKVIELNPENEKLYTKVYREIGESFDIEVSLREILELNPRDDKVYSILGFIYQSNGRLDEAVGLFRKAIELDPKNDWAYFGLGWIYRKVGKFSEAEELIKKAIELNPKNDWAYILLGEIYFERKSFEIAEGLFRKAVALAPKQDTWAYTKLGLFLSRDRQRLLESEQVFKKAIEVKPGHEGAYIRLGLLYQKQSRFFEAEELFRQAIKLDPENDIAYRALESLYKEMDEKELAEEYSKKVSRLALNEYSPVAVTSYRKLKKILDKRGIRLICMQYPMRNIEPLKKIFIEQNGIIFIDNEKIFKEAIARRDYRDYFIDMFAGDFGHCTVRGNELLAENIANVIIKEYFKK